MGARGPLPQPDHRHRNAPTIPTTALPAAGRQGPTPDCPYTLGERGAEWWEWAWHTPQAVAWNAGDLYALARRATMEDPKTVLDKNGEQVEIDGGTHNEKVQLDDRYGLTNKGMAALRWKIVDDEDVPAVVPSDGAVSELADRRKKLRAS